MEKVKVLVIDDSAVARQTLSEIISSEPSMEVMGTAADPFFAAEKIKKQIPDVITLDIEMPRMDGLTFLKKLMAQYPIPVVVISSLTISGSETAMKALQYGATEVITKPQLSTREFYLESSIRIIDAIKAASIVSIEKIKSNIQKNFIIQPKISADAVLTLGKKVGIFETTEKVIVLGASTGGTQAITEVLSALDYDCPGIVIVQHMPEFFTASFAKRLNEVCKITVKEAENNDTILRGQALIAPGNKHLLLKRSGTKYFVEVKNGPLVNRHRPSVDVLFRSAARYAGKNAIGIILTGMGDDGAKGLWELKQNQAYTIAQDEKSSVVYGMPNAAVKINAVEKSMNLKEISDYIISIS